jgi:hypothetical protein
MGDIPAKTAMISTVITNPQQGGAEIPSDTTFNITLQVSNLVAGSFTNADATYYAAPQFLSGGKVVGHTHVTVQDLGANLNPTQPLDPTQFSFFKGINDAGDGKGGLSAEVTGGLPAGNYRVCTLTSASNHQPVLMPVAQRGSQDDCTKFVVSGNGKTANAAANNGAKGVEAADTAASAVAIGADVNVSSSAAATAATATAAAANAKGAKGAAAGNAKGAANASGAAANAKSSAAAKAGSAGKAQASGAAAAKGAAAGNAKGGNANAKGGNANAKAGQGQKQRARREFIA